MVQFLRTLRSRSCHVVARLLFLCIAVLAANHAPWIGDLSRAETEKHVEELEAKEVVHNAVRTRDQAPKRAEQPELFIPLQRKLTRSSQCEARPTGWMYRLGGCLSSPMRC